ncbi:patatin-like phospholipase RssA [Celerinatantimonas sp. YJH-8]|uniref:patatin-like phospholipase RssA n=1 Tax=Celerinatantimonas sp. YJH-8 TaxID=3228714 RepID=UPI0038C2867C
MYKQIYPNHPKIGIALGSGAAKGWAHIGVLKALEELNIYPEVVAGCSIGAFVGASYANRCMGELEPWVCSLTNWEVFKLLDVGFHRGGLIAGKKVFSLADDLLGPRNIEASQLPFAMVATELYSGHEIWLQRGNMRRAVRASCAMPGLLSPIRWHGQWLVDGAVSNPVPVSLCRALGATHVIAVDLQAHRFSRKSVSLEPILLHDRRGEPRREGNDTLFSRMMGVGTGYFHSVVGRLGGRAKVKRQNDTPNMMAVMSGSLDILEDKLKRSRMAGDPPEVLIAPQVSDIGLMEFFRAQECIDLGYQAVMRISHQFTDMLP